MGIAGTVFLIRFLYLGRNDTLLVLKKVVLLLFFFRFPHDAKGGQSKAKLFAMAKEGKKGGKKGGKKADPRFASLTKDARFMKGPAFGSGKVKINERFEGMFNDPHFQDSVSQVFFSIFFFFSFLFFFFFFFSFFFFFLWWLFVGVLLKDF